MSLLSSLEDTYLTFGDKDANQQIIHSVTKLTGVNHDSTTHINTNRNDGTELYDDINAGSTSLQTNTTTTVPTSKRSGSALNTFNNFNYILTGSSKRRYFATRKL